MSLLIYTFKIVHVPVFLVCLTIRVGGEGVVNDSVKGAGSSSGGHSRESGHQTGKNEELLLSTVVPQGLKP